MTFEFNRCHRGAAPVSRRDLANIPVTPRGTRSDRWAGIQHAVLADLLVERVQDTGLRISSERWNVSRAGARLFGYLDLDVSGVALALERVQALDEFGELSQWRRGIGAFNPRLVSLRMGVMHSNDSSMALRLVVMPVVLVCSNGMSVEGGTIAIQRKHTCGLDLDEVLDQGVRMYLELTRAIDGTIQALRSVDLSEPQTADHLIVEAGRQKLFPWSQLGKVERHWRKPPHPEFEERSGWSLMNAFTEVAKSFSMEREMAACSRIRQLILSKPNGMPHPTRQS